MGHNGPIFFENSITPGLHCLFEPDPRSPRQSVANVLLSLRIKGSDHIRSRRLQVRQSPVNFHVAGPPAGDGDKYRAPLRIFDLSSLHVANGHMNPFLGQEFQELPVFLLNGSADRNQFQTVNSCLLYTSDAADEL